MALLPASRAHPSWSGTSPSWQVFSEHLSWARPWVLGHMDLNEPSAPIAAWVGGGRHRNRCSQVETLSLWKPKEGSLALGVGKGIPILEGGMLEVKEGRRRQEPRRGGVSGVTGVLLGTEQGFVITQ